MRGACLSWCGCSATYQPPCDPPPHLTPPNVTKRTQAAPRLHPAGQRPPRRPGARRCVILLPCPSNPHNDADPIDAPITHKQQKRMMTGLATAFLREGVVLPAGTPEAERAEALRLLRQHFAATPAMLIQFKVGNRAWSRVGWSVFFFFKRGDQYHSYITPPITHPTQTNKQNSPRSAPSSRACWPRGATRTGATATWTCSWDASSSLPSPNRTPLRYPPTIWGRSTR